MATENPVVPSPAPAELVQSHVAPAPVEQLQSQLAPAPAELVQSQLAPAPAELVLRSRSPVTPKPKKRSRCLGPPFHDQLYAQSGKKIEVKIEVPSADEECPLTFSPMAEDTLEFLQPSTTYITAFPDAKKMVLPCGHSFGALNILYHFARRNMLCPCCRAGINARLSSFCVPSSFRKIFMSKVQQELRKETEEQAESDHRFASSLMHVDALALVRIVDTRIFYTDVTIDGTVTMNIKFLNYNESRPPLATFSVPLIMRVDTSNVNRWIFFLGNGSVRSHLNSVLADTSVSALELCSVMEISARRDVEIANSGTILLDRSQNRDVFCILAEGDSHFNLELLNGGSQIAKLEWSAPLPLLQGIH